MPKGGKQGWIGTPMEGPYLPICWKMCAPPMHVLRRVVATSYLRWSDGVSCSTSSQMFGSWYFSRFPLRNGSLTWINMVCLPAYSREAVHTDGGVLWPACAGRWRRGLWDVLSAYSQRAFLIPQYIAPHSPLGCISFGILPHFFVWWYPSPLGPLTELEWYWCL